MKKILLPISIFGFTLIGTTTVTSCNASNDSKSTCVQKRFTIKAEEYIDENNDILFWYTQEVEKLINKGYTKITFKFQIVQGELKSTFGNVYFSGDTITYMVDGSQTSNYVAVTDCVVDGLLYPSK